MKRYLLKRTLPILFLSLVAGNSYGQFYNTIFWLQGIPQSSYSNPALMPQPRFYFGMPGVSSIYAGGGHSGFAIKDFLRKDSMDALYWDEDNMLGKLKSNNLLDVDTHVELLAFGFRANRNYLNFNITENVSTRFAYPKDFMVLLLKGNDQFLQEDRLGNFAGLGIDYMHYREFGMSFSREWTDRLTAGVRLKALQGLSNIWFESSELSLLTNPETYGLLLDANLLVNVSSPVAFSPLDSLNSDFEFEPDYYDYMTNFNNLGGALDFGLTFKATERFTLALSATDIGFIRWKQGVENFALDGTFEFDGIDLGDFFGADDDENSGFDQVLDSLKNVFDITETTRAYRQRLPARFYASVAYDLGPRHKLGLLARGELYNGTMYPSFTFSYNVKPIHAFSLALTYSVIHWNYANLGVGFNLNLGPMQIYLVSNNMFGAIQPHAIQSASAHFGLNWVFGYRPKKEEVIPSISW
jgi:hypothetical protein